MIKLAGAVPSELCKPGLASGVGGMAVDEDGLALESGGGVDGNAELAGVAEGSVEETPSDLFLAGDEVDHIRIVPEPSLDRRASSSTSTTTAAIARTATTRVRLLVKLIEVKVSKAASLESLALEVLYIQRTEMHSITT